MPRDVNGNYLLPAGNPVQSGALIESDWANTTMADLAAEITDSLSRSGKGGFTDPVGIVDKSGAVPGLNFINEPTSGLKREAGGDIRVQVQGVETARWTTGIQYVRSGGALKEVVVEESGVKIFRGEGGATKCWFYNSTVPSPWVLANPDGNIRDLQVGGTGGQIAGTDDPQNLDASVSTSVTVDLPSNTGDRVLTVAQMPAHTHDEGAHSEFGTGTAIGSGLEGNDGRNFLNFRFKTFPTGNNAPHNHPLGGQATGTGTGSISTIQPRYAMGVIGTL